MKWSIILFTLTLSGCSIFQKSVPVKPNFPEAVPELKEKCPDLITLEGNQVAITDLLKAIVKNYQLYYECSLKNEGWNRWYEEQRKIYESVK